MGVSWEGDCCGYPIISELIVKRSKMYTCRQTPPLAVHAWQGSFALCFMGLSHFPGDPRCESLCRDGERVGVIFLLDGGAGV